jgi:hypothetical protein
VGGGTGGSTNSIGGNPLGGSMGSSSNSGGTAGGGAAIGSSNSAGASRSGTSSGRGGSGAGPSSNGGSRGTQTGGSAPGTPSPSSPSPAGPTTVGSIGGLSGGGRDLPSGLTPDSGGDRGSVVLAPSGVLLRGARQDFERVTRPLTSVPGTPMGVVQACWRSLAAAAAPYGAIRLDAASAGQATQGPRGDIVAPLEARVLYARGSAREIRQSRVTCRVNARGQVMALL